VEPWSRHEVLWYEGYFLGKVGWLTICRFYLLKGLVIGKRGFVRILINGFRMMHVGSPETIH
tara:strand:+ start:261 stop:446 length:186 start_codon:yes stop_codon:yes gene_type:complete